MKDCRLFTTATKTGILSLSVRNFLNESLSDAANIFEYSRVNKSKAASIADTVTETSGVGVGTRAP